MYKNRIFFLYFISLSLTLSGQNIKSVKKNIKQLCSPKLHGRGYVFEGDKKAAEYIAEKFEDIELERNEKNSYYQNFPLTVNTFPNNVELVINDIKLEVGVDYIPATDSGSGTSNGELFFMDDAIFMHEEALKEFTKKDLSNSIVVYDQEQEKKRMQWSRPLMEKILQAKASIILFDDKLTFGVARWQMPKPRFYVLRNKMPEVVNSCHFTIQSQLKENYISQNVIGKIKGTETPKEFIFFTAHYDHLGAIGKQKYFAGANDNASGVAMLLEIAKYYKSNPPKSSVVFIAFGAEEAGLIGSRYYVENPTVALEKIKFLVNLDLFGTGEEGMMAVNGKVYTDQYELLSNINTKNHYLSAVKSRGKAANSDHYYFSENGVPSFFFYLMGKSWTHYHDIYDDQPLPLSDFSNAFQLITDFGDALMN
ncbi:M20/M25/M40 family metallo-hydrolase [Flammeovirga sp. SR4]|uniref:M20/M25/M40 family metallo-hydrolase n=1 Tax=Flammeovirga agarivorans TaxID=2726742 RepID=A0A7X8SMZ1_9BACT|nr:M20/M25/M40 family metallo-hydrolase [Flammeovirga agarivorans]